MRVLLFSTRLFLAAVNILAAYFNQRFGHPGYAALSATCAAFFLGLAMYERKMEGEP
jgi:hypothetical protein